MTALAHPDIARNRVVVTREAAEFCGISLSTFRRLNARNQFPAPIRLSERRLGWRISALLEWLDCREQGRDWHEYRASLAGNDNRKSARP